MKSFPSNFGSVGRTFNAFKYLVLHKNCIFKKILNNGIQPSWSFILKFTKLPSYYTEMEVLAEMFRFYSNEVFLPSFYLPIYVNLMKFIECCWILESKGASAFTSQDSKLFCTSGVIMMKGE